MKRPSKGLLRHVFRFVVASTGVCQQTHQPPLVALNQLGIGGRVAIQNPFYRSLIVAQHRFPKEKDARS
jgi:hypothetical protein